MKYINHKNLVLSLYLILFSIVTACDRQLEKSFENIAANPEAFEGQIVEVEGLFRRDLGVFLYLNIEHADTLEIDTAIEVQDKSVEDLLVSGCKDQFVRIVGKIVASHGRAKITDFESVYSADNKRICWEKK